MIRQRRSLQAGLALLAPVMLASCVSGGANQPVNFGTPPPIGLGQLTSSAATLTFPGVGSAYALTFTVDYPGYTGTLTIDTSNCGSGAAALVAVSPTTITTYPTTVTATPQHAGTCTVTVSDNAHHTLPIPVAVNSAGVVVTGRPGR